MSSDHEFYLGMGDESGEEWSDDVWADVDPAVEAEEAARAAEEAEYLTRKAASRPSVAIHYTWNPIDGEVEVGSCEDSKGNEHLVTIIGGSARSANAVAGSMMGLGSGSVHTVVDEVDVFAANVDAKNADWAAREIDRKANLRMGLTILVVLMLISCGFGLLLERILL